MGFKDAFKGDKWYKPLGTSYHGGGAYEGRGKSPEDAKKKAKEREIASNVSQAQARINGCKNCKKKGLCDKHISDSKYITKHSK